MQEKRDGYIQVCFGMPPVLKEAVCALMMTALFAVPLGGLYILEPFYREYLNSRPSNTRGKKGRSKQGQEDAAT